MSLSLSGNALWQLVRQSDFVTWCVLALLFLMSVTCWSITLYKVLVWRVKKRQLKDATAHIKNAKNLEDVLYASSKFTGTLAGYFLGKSLSTLKSLLMSERGGKTQLDDREWGFLLHSLNQILDTVLDREQANINVLAVSAALAPLLGLFGTIWGLVHAFLDISQKQAADITVIAPGIAEALMTTLAGLMVAIPAVASYHYLLSQLRTIERQCTVLSDRFAALTEKLFNVYQEGQ